MIEQLLRLGVVPTFEMIEVLRAEEGSRLDRSADETIVRLPGARLATVPKTKIKSIEFERRPKPCEIRLEKPGGSVRYGGYRLEWRIRQRAKPDYTRRRAGREWFDADKVGDRIVLRLWAPGDRFRPIGRQGSAKLQDLFTAAKIPVEKRRRLLVASDVSGQIWWVDGLRIGDEFKIGPESRRYLEWKWALK